MKLFHTLKPELNVLFIHRLQVPSSTTLLQERSLPMLFLQLRKTSNNSQACRANQEDYWVSISTLWFRWWRKESPSPCERDSQVWNLWREETSLIICLICDIISIFQMLRRMRSWTHLTLSTSQDTHSKWSLNLWSMRNTVEGSNPAKCCYNCLGPFIPSKVITELY